MDTASVILFQNVSEVILVLGTECWQFYNLKLVENFKVAKLQHSRNCEDFKTLHLLFIHEM
jgi:hypothetical protein